MCGIDLKALKTIAHIETKCAQSTRTPTFHLHRLLPRQDRGAYKVIELPLNEHKDVWEMSMERLVIDRDVSLGSGHHSVVYRGETVSLRRQERVCV